MGDVCLLIEMHPRGFDDSGTNGFNLPMLDGRFLEHGTGPAGLDYRSHQLLIEGPRVLGIVCQANLVPGIVNHKRQQTHAGGSKQREEREMYRDALSKPCPAKLWGLLVIVTSVFRGILAFGSRELRGGPIVRR